MRADRPLWTAAAIAAATGGTASTNFAANGVAFDSREVGQGDLFVALSGEATDGHRFVAQALAQGAAGAIVSRQVDGPHVLVDDTTVALNLLATASRAHTASRIVGVTGSVGKTGTKEALFAALDRITHGHAHRSVKSYNNHTGVPLSLARMPADTQAAVFEMGMNHAGELSQLTRLVRPEVAIVTTIAPAHTEFFTGEDAIARAKGEIFEGLVEGGTAIVPFDSPHRDTLIAAARPYAAKIVTFGLRDGADVRAIEHVRMSGGDSFVTARLGSREVSYTLAPPGEHWVANSLAVMAAVDAIGGDLGVAGLALADLAGLAGRGARRKLTLAGGEALLIDESYNANPASMRATLKVLAAERADRRVAVLGEMRELGESSDAYHAALAVPIDEAGVSRAILVGQGMLPLAKALEGRIETVHVPDAAAAARVLSDLIAPGDAVLVKGSNGVGLARVVADLWGQG
ncbi:UDP-N-acetylmuramoylalanyl-D-glutamyl-2, 6-diaminopimelate--D-alanyl-D-alanine ligase [Sphingomonas sp. Leaf16]|nr:MULTISPECIES: UDP-N-acetylmuramoyl-tripeptide--D-alanyl-D-alanine ligase [unclassified Sphingomonas]KQM66664.1 UDP-N-acetylmuramoylalanyl-D-glutamyl-2, 6-diaminopimelate--D-alanyl-D-alanine ligase [Sphingomonas sp. Leaf16]KQN17613.1 UDP-N-acetylmuramoylalanyl-D-glutamyl-2, 6-diaminopimelate--D-alanyl-D-alanine ligase [Sphingomonas sp. Leaf29]KQN23477.1 UDP-N-acetylmuramoylalanyl-D-glutamyl-2, 6-diaminopimelate--D-alanyl-D-alanine ligase [Sphingomonas sp. Leaf32]